MVAAKHIVGNRYRLIQLIGQGAMGTVWCAEHIRLGSRVAIKLIETSIAQNPEVLERFQREAKAAAAISCPYVVQIYDFGVDDGIPYIAMELLVGESLGDRIKRAFWLNAPDTYRILSHVGMALEKAHEAGLVHRDIKPDNIFLTQGHDGQVLAKVLDFGVAKDLSAMSQGSSHTRTGAMIGSPCYMSPEQIEGKKFIDHRADLWALGVIAFECLTGRRPFMGEGLAALLYRICNEPLPIPSTVASVPVGFDMWFAKACTRDPNYRFQHSREMVEALGQVLSGQAMGFGMPQQSPGVDSSMPGTRAWQPQPSSYWGASQSAYAGPAVQTGWPQAGGVSEHSGVVEGSIGTRSPSTYFRDGPSTSGREPNPQGNRIGGKSMAVSLSKGGNVSLSKEAPSLKAIMVGLGWDVRSTDGSDFDLDASAFLLKEDGKVRSDRDFIFYNNLKSDDGSVEHTGDNTVGGGEDAETIKIALDKVPAGVQRVSVTVTIHDAEARRQSFGMVANAFIRVVNQADNKEIARFDLSEDTSTETAMIFGEIYRHGGEWKFKAIGQGFAGGLHRLAKNFGVNL